ncbi:MAG: hypothetical protein ACOYT8_05730 [Candidatus Dependentiae bacterium]
MSITPYLITIFFTLLIPGTVNAMENNDLLNQIEATKKISIIEHVSQKLWLLEKDSWSECCIKKAASFQQLEAHVQKKHKIGANYLCSICQATYMSAKRAVSCLVKHTNTRFFSCPLCRTNNTRFENLIAHCKKKCIYKENFIPESYTITYQSLCENYYKIKLPNKNIIESVHETVDERIKKLKISCCSLLIENFQQLSNHMSQSHSDTIRIQCPACENCHYKPDKAASCFLYKKDNNIFCSPGDKKKLTSKDDLLRHVAKATKQICPIKEIPNENNQFDYSPPTTIPTTPIFENPEINSFIHPSDFVILRVLNYKSDNLSS